MQQVFETIYASVEHILSGKAISRAVRAHLLVDAVLNGLVLADCLKVPLIMTRDQHNAEIIPESSIADPFLSETEILQIYHHQTQMISLLKFKLATRI